MHRQELWITFMTRHLPFTNGTSPMELDFYIPARWTQTYDEPAVAPVTASASASTVTTTTPEVDDTKMWDFGLNKWVPNIMGTEDPEEEAGPKIVVKKKKKKKTTRKRKKVSRSRSKKKQRKKKK